MTWKQFLKAYSRIPFFLDGNDIRAKRCKTNSGVCACPLVAVANRKAKKRKFGNADYIEAAEYLGLDKVEGSYIINAADNCCVWKPEVISRRQELLENMNIGCCA